MYLTVLFLNGIACFLFSVGFLRRYVARQKGPFDIPLEGAVLAGLIFSAETWLFVEGVSLFNGLGNPVPLAILYLLTTIGLSVGAWLLRDSLRASWRDLRETAWNAYVRNLALGILLLIFIPLLFLAIYYPPRTADSMSYHLPRIMHWMQNGNIELYPTNYPRQVYYQPFAEYLMLPWMLLSGGDFFVNSVQTFALAGVLCLSALLVRFFGGGGYAQILAVVFVLACPIALFEAPTTQTDIILIFYFFSFLYYGLRLTARENPGSAPAAFTPAERRLYAVCMAVALGLSLNTKISVGLFELPFCLWFAGRLLAVHRQKAWSICAFLTVGFLFFNAPYFYRNIAICGNVLGPTEVRNKMTNARFGLDVAFSNTARNIGMQLLVPNPELNDLNLWVMMQLHRATGIPWNDHDTTYKGDGQVPFEYKTEFFLDDYRSGNTLILVLFTIIAFGQLGAWASRLLDPGAERRQGRLKKVSREDPRKKTGPDPAPGQATTAGSGPNEDLFFEQDRAARQGDLAVYTWMLVLGFVLFGALFRWQPFGSRLLLPVFLGVIPFVSIGLCRFLPKARVVLFSPLFFGIALLYMIFNLSASAYFNPSDALIYAEETHGVDEAPATVTTTDAPGSTDSTDGTESRESPLPDESFYIERTVSMQSPELLDEFFTPRPPWEAFLVQRRYKYFRHAPFYMADQMSAANKILEEGHMKIGIAFDRQYDQWEYPFWALLKPYRPECRIQWAIFPEYLKKTPNYDPDFVPDVLITDFPPRLIQEYWHFDPERSYKYKRMVLLRITGRAGSADAPVSREPASPEGVE